MVGVYPTYVLRSGAFLAGAFFLFSFSFSQKSAPFYEKCIFCVCMIKPPFILPMSVPPIPPQISCSIL